ncbi:MAG TPA: hypothetical protein VIK05_08535, partial [Ilumatobacteraceae bacterium]
MIEAAPPRHLRRRDGRERLPLGALLIALVAIAFFALPFIGLLWRVPWGEAWDVLTQKSVRTALWLSIKCSLSATALALFFGVPLA